MSRVTVPTENYYKARKSYLLVSGVLGVWELIGVTLQKVPIEDLELEVVVRSPEAVPYALMFVLIYLAYRFSVEWRYCEHANRARVLSKVDFALAHTLAAGAVILFSYQKWSGVLVGNVLVEADPLASQAVQQTMVDMFHLGLGLILGLVFDSKLGTRNGIRAGIIVLGVVVSSSIFLLGGFHFWSDWGLGLASLACVMSYQSLRRWATRVARPRRRRI